MMTFSVTREDLGDSVELAETKILIEQARFQEKLGKQRFHHDAEELFEKKCRNNQNNKRNITCRIYNWLRLQL